MSNLDKQNNLISKVEEEPYIGSKEAAEILRITENYLYNLTSTKKIPYYKPFGKKLYFKKSELQNFIKQSANKK